MSVKQMSVKEDKETMCSMCNVLFQFGEMHIVVDFDNVLTHCLVFSVSMAKIFKFLSWAGS